ncbi:hypothetical protein [Microbacterium stercoris]|uniref:Uncharacterized protein n=1 Tax=Microbacterium stercoris TaxID=2820289 RepID=A0A939QSV9_9MICO|nr:hypothetical protein [Microbacterium stercoris]MBO3664046.1 hypothetical protein [Microbacterium stercoris]
MAWHRRGADPEELAALHPGVPTWLRRFLLAWVEVVAYEGSDYPYGTGRKPNALLLAEYETSIRRSVSLVNEFQAGGADRLLIEMGEAEFLDFVDFLIYKVEEQASGDSRRALAKLETILADAGSEWRVGSRAGFASLEKRVPEGVVEAAESTITGSGSAGALLSESWHAAFGRNPDTEEAYEKAIKAVEEAGAHVVTPNNKKATLGSMIRDMKAQKDWKLDLPTPDADVPLKMAEALWVGQESRHGGNGYRKPTQAEAEAAVLLAVPLVQWFTSGALQRRP